MTRHASMFSPQGGALYTLGCGHMLGERVVTTLEAREVGFVFDLRSPPFDLSRPDLEPDALGARFEAAGTRYVRAHEELGDRPQDISLYVESGARIDYTKYAARESAKRMLARLEDAWQGGYRVALLGRTSDPALAHRARFVSEALYQRAGIVARHLVVMGSSTISHTEVRRMIWGMRDTITLSARP